MSDEVDTRVSAIATADDLRAAAEVTRVQDQAAGAIAREFGPAMAMAIAKMDREQAIEEIGEFVKEVLRLGLAKAGI